MTPMPSDQPSPRERAAGLRVTRVLEAMPAGFYSLDAQWRFAAVNAEAERLLRHWMSHGVRIFRVDNPHTKPLWFWEWLLDRVRKIDDGVVFLAEAFTRPAMMQGLAKAGFQQSYSYFTWRNTKAELEEFLQSISDETADFMRPNLFVNTHDILTEYLQYGGRPAYKIRAAIAPAPKRLTYTPPPAEPAADAQSQPQS